jgi:hypothetical protein
MTHPSYRGDIQVESLLSNSLVDGEVTDEFREFADGEIKKQAKNRRERENKASAMQNYFTARPPSHEELRNANAYIEESAMTETLFRCTQSLQWSLVAPGQADILVTNNVASIPPELHWPALLNGMWVVNPAAIVGGCGPSTIKFKASTEIKRSLWLSHGFLREHEWLAIQIDAAMQRGSNKWKLLANVEEFADKKQKAVNAKSSASVVALVSTAERTQYAGVQHVMTAVEFQVFCTRLDTDRCTLVGMGTNRGGWISSGGKQIIYMDLL